MNEIDTMASTVTVAATGTRARAITGPGSAPFWVALGAAGFAVAGLAATDDGPVLCLFRLCTGGYCPACGMTRATGQLLRGDLAASWRHHPFLLLAIIQTVVFGTVALALAHRARSATGSRGGRSVEMTRAGPMARLALLARWDVIVGLNIALLMAIWVVRLAAGTIPIPFA